MKRLVRSHSGDGARQHLGPGVSDPSTPNRNVIIVNPSQPPSHGYAESEPHSGATDSRRARAALLWKQNLSSGSRRHRLCLLPFTSANGGIHPRGLSS